MDALPLRDELRGMSPYGAPQLEVPFPMNTNENPYPPSEGLVAAIGAAAAAAAADLNRYPDRDAVALRTDLASYLSAAAGHPLSVQQVWAANGSNEVLQQICQAFGGPGRTALGFEPSYSMHHLIAAGTATGWVGAQRGSDFSIDPVSAADAVHTHRPSITFLCSPNNPTGTALPPDVLSQVCAAAGEVGGVVVVDEAYGEFARPGTPSALRLLDENPHLIVTRTMSKAFALAGGRLGYLAASPQVVDALQLVRLPYHLSSVTQAVARTALAHAAELLGTVEAIKAQRDRIVDELRDRSLEVADSDANFVLFGRFADRHAVWQALLDQGVLIREIGPDGWLRVTAGLVTETDAFLAALDHTLATPTGARA
jgi:histidinol-phosphate aminotransferase